MKELISPGAQAPMVSDIEELFLDQRVPCTTSAPPLASLWSNGRRLKLKNEGIVEWLGRSHPQVAEQLCVEVTEPQVGRMQLLQRATHLRTLPSLVRLSAVQTRPAERLPGSLQ